MKHLYTSLFVILLTTLSLLPVQSRADVPEPLTITALQASTVKFYYGTAPSTKAHEKLSYSKDKVNWTDKMSYNTVINLDPGESLYIRGKCTTGINNTSNNTNIRYQFRISGSVDLSGDLMSLIDYTQQVTTIPCDYCFFWLFCSNEGTTEHFNRESIHSAKNLRLSATTLTPSCYEGLFRNCRNMVDGPDLSAATNIPSNAFKNIFYYCQIMTNSPALPSVETVGEGGFYEMFYHCDALSAFPALNYSTMGNSACRGMFSYCATPKTAPALPATTIGTNCYQNMFTGCTALETAPELPATTLATDCYNAMFSGCSSLTDAPSELPATTLVARCYKNMFNGCTSLVNAPVIKAISIPSNSTADAGCMEYMFQGCIAIRNIKVYFTAWDTNTAHNNTKNATYGWLKSAYNNSQCRFLYPYVFQNPTADRGENRIPTNWNPLPFYTYTFNVSNNDGTWDGTTPAADGKYERVHGEQLTSAPSNPQKEGYKFKGWYTTANDDSETGSKIELDNMTALNANQTFYARFELPAYTFDVNTTGGTWDGSDVANRVLYSELPNATPQKTGYIFLGWYTTSEGEGSTITADNKSTYTSDQTFYARFRLPDYTFNVTTNGGTWDGTDANNRVLNGALPDATPQKTGYIFLGWYTTSEGEGSTITADNKSTYTSDQTFYARFQLQPEPQSGVTELDDTQDNSALLESLNNVTGDVLLKGRTLVGGCVNTLCLPFSLTAEQLAASPLNNCTIWEFSNFTFDGETLSVNVEPTTTLTAGVPYLVEPASNISTLLFSNVTISASTAQMRGNSSIRFIGLFSPYTLTAGSQDQLFVGAGNKLLRPSSTSALRGFRAWFRLNDGPAQAAPRAKLTFGEKPQVPTGLDNTEKDNSPRKIFINGQLYITHDGATYTPAGNVMPK